MENGLLPTFATDTLSVVTLFQATVAFVKAALACWPIA